ncbi:hypothetical protein Asppvi_005674 [Aspergillus pseudoviridinutans]|uniref:Zn(2)-C6 fungal-type domain-containing protein n=1 Tax=Aspergillus pseudoviridinutans TaxID=1517512 RepID=A0A9P3BBB0_9EURO|nr:uncharacterized protein Asppvi_005674 [Aspergillus pseudoviridinutans]GIJ86779.1 hypothetical protein Asppvi_005674 [Aspergillus pseudoviridinutans]
MVRACGTRQLPGVACEECRRRKARCDRVRPQCGICAEAGRICVVVDKRPQRGPKKGQIKDLRSRIAMLEQRLESQDWPLESDVVPLGLDEVTPEREIFDERGSYASVEFDPFPMLDFSPGGKMPETSDFMAVSGYVCNESPVNSGLMSPYTFTTNIQQAPITPFSPVKPTGNQMITCDGELQMSDLVRSELDLLYFERVHPIAPMIHKRRYFSWASDETPTPARACLRSAMRTVAAAMSTQLQALGDALYAATRRMLEAQDVHGETGLPWMTSVRGRQGQIEHERTQAWLLLAHYEFLRMPEQQALLTAGRAFRLLQLSRLFDLDAQDENAPALSASDSSSGPQAMYEEAWIETEEKRRTLWAAFILDRLSSMLNDRPLMLHEEIIRTRLPMSEADFQNGREPIRMGFLPETTGNSDGCGTLPPFAECVVLSNLFERCISHRRLAHSIPLSGSESASQAFWKRHEWLAAAAASATRSGLRAQSASAVPGARDSSVAKCDPMRSFNRILAYSASVSLSSTAEASPWQSLGDHLMALTYKQLAYQAASEVVHLMRNAPRIAFLKMHPFLPNTIALVASFLNATSPNLASPDEERLEGVNDLLSALRYLSDVNNLARDLLYKLEADVARTTPLTMMR